jgi:uncharacterized RDD family membrane protein YckC
LETIVTPSISPYESLAGQVPAGFWQRLFAFAIDAIVVSIPCFTLAELFHNFFESSPFVAKLLGFAITTIYFAIFGSGIVEGQTLGMMPLRLRVVSGDGATISVLRSSARYLILFVPFLLNSNVLPARVPAVVATSYETVLTIVAFAIVYIAIFNRKTGQSLHDLATHTFVVDSSGRGPVHAQGFWRPHWVFIAGLLVLSYGLVEIIPRTSRTFSELTTIQRSVQSTTGLGSVNIAVKFSGGRSGLEIDADCGRIASDPNKAASVIAAAALVADAKAGERDYISIDCIKTVSVGFFKSTNRESFVHTPEEWQKIIQKKAD